MNFLRRLLILTALCGSIAFGAKVTITSPGFVFSPNTVTVTSGDTVIFALTSIHNAVEVSQATWNADQGTAMNGGFSVNFGGGSVVMTQTGTHYYVCTLHAAMGMKGIITVQPAVTGVADQAVVPSRYELDQAYPNPFNPATTIRYSLPAESNVQVSVFNLIGQQIATLSEGIEAAGVHAARWNAGGNPSGIYFVRFEASPVAANRSAFSQIIKIVLQK